MARIINRKSSSIIRPGADEYAFVSPRPRFLFFSKAAARLCGLTHDKFIHFINDQNYWAFYLNDNIDGFELKPCSKNSGAFYVYSSGLAEIFTETVECEYGERFFIDKTSGFVSEDPIFEIQTHSSVSVMVDKVVKMNAQKDIEKKYVLNLLPGKGKATK